MIVEVTALPKSGRFSIEQKNGRIGIHLKSAPEGNKANLELVKKLSKALKTDVRIISGQKSRIKKLEIDISQEEWDSFVNQRE